MKINENLDANLIKKYHQDLVFNYSEYPTKDHWSFKFGEDNYKDALLDWLGLHLYHLYQL